jgi:hypothetical protein
MFSVKIVHNSKALGRLTVLVFVLFAFRLQLSTTAAGHDRVPIKEKKPPIYAPIARQARLTGDVQLVAEIDRDGVVTSVHGCGAAPLLCKIAEDNLREWKFGPFPVAQKFPLTYKITYSYRIVGPLQAGQPHPAPVAWDLPNRVIITAEVVAVETSN